MLVSNQPMKELPILYVQQSMNHRLILIVKVTQQQVLKTLLINYGQLLLIGGSYNIQNSKTPKQAILCLIKFQGQQRMR